MAQTEKRPRLPRSERGMFGAIAPRRYAAGTTPEPLANAECRMQNAEWVLPSALCSRSAESWAGPSRYRGHKAASDHVSPARDARLPSNSGWCPGPAALPSPSFRSIRAARDGSNASCKQGGTVEHQSAENRHAGKLGAKRGRETKAAAGGLFQVRVGAKATRPRVQFAA